MVDDIDIRPGRPEDLAALEALYPAAFPDEDLLPLVRDLVGASDGVLSLVAVCRGAIVGHVGFTRCAVAGGSERIALLAPLAVTPARQTQGIGSALVRDGLRRLRATGTELVLVLGDPAYYGRFGFEPDERIAPPYPLPAAWAGAWQSLRLDGVAPPLAGVLQVPPFWMRPAVWAP